MIQPYLPSMRRHCAEAPHGQRNRYAAGCRCDLCKRANADYEHRRAVARIFGDWNGYVSARTARGWIERLGEQGVGYKAVAAAAGTSHTTIFQILSGQKLKIRARTERKIMAVDATMRADGSLVSATRTWKLIRDLVGRGWTKAWIAGQLGYAVPALQFGKQRISARNALNVERLYKLIQQGKVSR